jgi:hypothetical protein
MIERLDMGAIHDISFVKNSINDLNLVLYPEENESIDRGKAGKDDIRVASTK